MPSGRILCSWRVSLREIFSNFLLQLGDDLAVVSRLLFVAAPPGKGAGGVSEVVADLLEFGIGGICPSDREFLRGKPANY
jgi:hypothetical protein